jgi:hypothetical protein
MLEVRELDAAANNQSSNLLFSTIFKGKGGGGVTCAVGAGDFDWVTPGTIATNNAAQEVMGLLDEQMRATHEI